MDNDLKDSIKARLYDFKYTPFLASYTFFWLYYNAKLMLIFLSGKLSIQSKIDMLAYDTVNFITPLIFASLYTLVFPIFTLGFYYVTLWYKKNMSKIKQTMEDDTPLTQEEANNIKQENQKLRLEIDENIMQLDLSKKRYEDKIEKLAEMETTLENNFTNRESEIQKIYDEKIDEKVKRLEIDIHSINTLIVDKNTFISEQKDVISSLEKKLKDYTDKEKNTPKFELGTTTKVIKDAVKSSYRTIVNSTAFSIKYPNSKCLKILEIFNDNDSTMEISKLKDILKDKYNISKPQTQKDINILQNENLLSKTDIYRNISLTDNGLNEITNLFSN